MSDKMVMLVEGAAKARKDAPVARKFITLALEKIEKGEVQVESRYPTGAPSLRDVYRIAVALEAEASAKH